MFIRAVVLSAGVLTSAAAPPPDSVPLQPTGKWTVHFDDAQCLAERNYGSKDHPLYLALKQPPLGDVMQLDVIEGGTVGEASQSDARVWLDDSEPLKLTTLYYTPTNSKFRVHMMNLPRERFSSVSKAKKLRIRASGFDQTFALDSLGQLMVVMDQCVTDLRNVWNVGTSSRDEGGPREDAKGNLRGLFSSDDYPRDSFLNGETGAVRVALLVNEEGKVADCSVIQTSGVAMLDAQSCAVLKARARFVPAVGKDGRPAKDAFIQRINWRVSY